MPFAYVRFIDMPELPERPGWGHPDQGLPPVSPGYPDQGLPPGYPGRPSQGLPPSFPGHPSHGPVRPGLPVDPGWGVDAGTGAEQLPIWPLDPEHPDQGLPPIAGLPLPPIDPPPGTIWPPLPPSIPEGKAIALVAISGVGYRYAVIDVPPAAPDQGLPGEGEEPAPRARRK